MAGPARELARWPVKYFERTTGGKDYSKGYWYRYWAEAMCSSIGDQGSARPRSPTGLPGASLRALGVRRRACEGKRRMDDGTGMP